MKTWIYLLIGIIFVIGLSYSGQNYLHRSSARLEQALDRVDRALQQKNWPESLSLFGQAERSWEKTKRLWAVLTHHEQINLLDQSFIRTREAILIQNYPDVRMELGILRHLINHVIKREEFSISNIF